MDFALDLLARYLSRYTYLGLFLILSVGAFGFPIPEEFVLIAAGLFVAQGTSSIVPTLLACGAGQVIGDLLLFAVGRRYGTNAFHGAVKRLVPPERVERVFQLIGRYGLLVVFFGRYLTGVRPAVFLGAGATGISIGQFVLVDGASALVSLLVWVSLGWAFSPWIELALQAVKNAEEQILAAGAAVLLVLVLEKVLVRGGVLRRRSAPVRVTNWIRVPILVVTAVFAVLVAREHHITKRERFLAAITGGGREVISDLGLLIEVLPELSPSEEPIEIVFVGARPLLDGALANAGYRPGPPGEQARVLDRPADVRYRVGPVASDIDFWQTAFFYRGEPVWFGRFEREVSVRDIRELSKALLRSHYAPRTIVGPRVDPHRKQRVLVAVLRHPVIQP